MYYYSFKTKSVKSSGIHLHHSTHSAPADTKWLD